MSIVISESQFSDASDTEDPENPSIQPVVYATQYFSDDHFIECDNENDRCMDRWGWKSSSRPHKRSDPAVHATQYFSDEHFIECDKEDERFLANWRRGCPHKPNTQAASNEVSRFQPSDKLMQQHYSNKINVEKYDGPSLPHHAANVLLIENNKKLEKNRLRLKDKRDRASVEQVKDKSTRMILLNMIKKGLIMEINGCIGTGKEANVYHATSNSGIDLAIKIYRTSILKLQDRSAYMSGESRSHDVSRKRNPRDTVKVWGEMERSNLTRLNQAGIKSPGPIILNKNVLLMDFVGNEGCSAPMLKDIILTPSAFRTVYRECVEMMWRVYHIAKLVHADLSEYNLLYHEGSLVMIDVSQAVENDNENAIQFLKKDCDIITQFFKKKGVAVMPFLQLFDFITDKTINESNMTEYLDAMTERMGNQGEVEADPAREIEEEVFKQAYIPQNLGQVIDPERDINLAKSGTDNLIDRTLVGFRADLTIAKKPEILDDNSENNEEDSDISGDESSDDEESKFVNASRPKNETPEEKKLRKKAVKYRQAEKRKLKMNKNIKMKKTKIQKKK